MSLRLRLIVAFFLLSVVPLGAITYYTYTSNAATIREAAGQEAALLSGELSQRMQTVTTQLSQRVEQLMRLSAPEAPAPVPAAPRSAVPAEVADPGVTSGPVPEPPGSAQVAETLGDFAEWLNNIELRPVRGRGGRGRDGGQRGGGDGRGRGPFLGPAPTGRGEAPAGGPGGPQFGPPPASTPPATLQPAGSSTGTSSSGSGQNPDQGSSRGGRNGGGSDGSGPSDSGRGGPGRPGGPGGPGGGGRGEPPPLTDPSRISIDLNRIRGAMFQELVPDREAFSQLPQAERDRIFEQIDQRMRGVQQGIDVLKTELAARLATAQLPETVAGAAVTGPSQRAAATTDGGRPSATSGPASANVLTPTPAAPAAPLAPTPPVAPAAPTSPATQRSTKLSGSRLAVSVQQDGEVVGQVDADVDLPKLLASVFSTTARDRGEVPFAVAQNGELFTPTLVDKARLEALNTEAVRPETPPGTTVMANWIVATTPDPTGSGLKFGIARPVGDALEDLQRSAATNAGLGLAFIGVALIGIVPLSGRLTRNLASLSEGVNRIAQGDYGARVEVRANDEVGRLARAFNKMAADVEVHQRSAVGQERLRRELELGRQIQHDMLPQVPLRLGLTEIKGVSVPAREVGGDFFNYFQLSNGTVALLVGDVSGKGVGAALLMANIQASLRTRLALGQDLASLANELDRDIEGSTPGPVYATLFVGIFDPALRVLRCVNAGHNPQYVLRQNGDLERMESTGLPIGLLAGSGYVEQRVQLAAGDLLFFYTDGCVEAENAAGDMFGPERLEQILQRSAGADDVLTAVETDVTRFRAGVELNDDATMMVVKVG